MGHKGAVCVSQLKCNNAATVTNARNSQKSVTATVTASETGEKQGRTRVYSTFVTVVTVSLYEVYKIENIESGVYI